MSKRRRNPRTPRAAEIPKSRGADLRGAESRGAATVFSLRFTQDAAEEIKKLDGSITKQLKNVLEKKLSIDPEGYGLPLRGPLAGYWKHEFANHRLVYRIYPAERVVAICAVGPRKQGDAQDIYKQLNKVMRTGRLAEQVASVLRKIIPGIE
jgi:mRNA-degrading endonuclease RelE of RelBE toxin-antitoxin system